jgi:hypothetical protein
MKDQITEASMTVLGPRPRGRPRLSDESCTSVSTWMPERYHDRLIAMANQKNVTVSRLVSQLLVIQLRKLP